MRRVCGRDRALKSFGNLQNGKTVPSKPKGTGHRTDSSAALATLAYTSAMTRLILAALGLSLILATAAIAQVKITPSPFWVQRNDNGKWGTLMIGPDVGSARAAVVLEAGESKEFPFRLNDSGKMRLRLNYRRGSIPELDCHALPKGLKLATSAVFTVE